MQSKNIRRVTAAALLAGLAGAAQAHTGHGTHSLMQGLTHPLGIDHLLAMVAVGVWSVSALPRDKAWQGPGVFLLSLILSAALGSDGFAVPFGEQGIALSVVLLGGLLMLARQPVPATWGLGLVAAAAALHGLAHGAEAPATGFAGYALGFLATTAALHIGGVMLGLGARRQFAERAGLALGSLGAALSVAGLALFGQLAA